ncbi:MAG: cytochrome C oxidase subunit IV family protein [Gammaproteobacteria bacterium]|nr:cytochrome C oxidase subunit IV family protein [Gammaproteobacteria bacterium]
MLHNKTIDVIWLLLMAITLLSAYIAESAEPSFFVTLTICIIITLKGRMICDRFMELETANQKIRKLMNIYFYVLPIMIMLVFLFPEQLANMTRL